MSTVEVLKEARQLLSDPARWCKIHSALTADGRSVAADDPEATCWCMIGAVGKVLAPNNHQSEELDDALGAATGLGGAAGVGFSGGASGVCSTTRTRPRAIAALDALREAANSWLATFNDRSTLAEVLAVFDRAIARLEASEERPPPGQGHLRRRK